jgi:hypothetical protein
MPSYLPSFRDQLKRRGRQRRYVQRLANVAGSFRTTSVLVDKDAASSEIQEDHAAK